MLFPNLQTNTSRNELFKQRSIWKKEQIENNQVTERIGLLIWKEYIFSQAKAA